MKFRGFRFVTIASLLLSSSAFANMMMSPGMVAPGMMAPTANYANAQLQPVQGPPGAGVVQQPSEGEVAANAPQQAMGCGAGHYGRIKDGFTIEESRSGSHMF